MSMTLLSSVNMSGFDFLILYLLCGRFSPLWENGFSLTNGKSAKFLFLSIDALTLGATVRLTNIQFNVELQDASSQAYTNLMGNILAEVRGCL